MNRSSVILETAFDLTALEAVRTQPWSDVWTIPWDVLRTRKVFPEMSFDEDVWVIPPSWASAGPRRARAGRTLKFAAALPQTWKRSDARSEAVLRRLKRLAIASLVMPTWAIGGRGQGSRPPPLRITSIRKSEKVAPVNGPSPRSQL